MNLRSAREELAFSVPAAVSTVTPAAPSRGVLTRAADAVRWFIDLPRRRALVDELSMLSDHELADIGLNRAELDRVFDPDFTSARADYRRVAACAARL